MATTNEQRNLLWLDLEMTGLDVAQDVILEVATVITDHELRFVAQGPSLVVHQSEKTLSVMNNKVAQMHKKSGLLGEIAQSSTSLQQAEQQTVAFLSQHAQKNSLLLAGNTVWQDRAFLVKHMPGIVEYLHYRIIDVSSVKELIRQWYPNKSHTKFVKPENHRAMEDVLASVEELRHYRKYFFIAPSDLV